MAFHVAVGEAAHNEVLANAAQLLRNVLKYWIHLKLMIGRVPAQALERHREIYEAICNRDIQASRELMQEHLDETSVLITRLTAGPARSAASKRKTRPAAITAVSSDRA